jgi:hypothetical protein
MLEPKVTAVSSGVVERPAGAFGASARAEMTTGTVMVVDARSVAMWPSPAGSISWVPTVTVRSKSVSRWVGRSNFRAARAALIGSVRYSV